MKHTREERLEIGRRIYTGELTRYEASEKYGVSEMTARDWMRLYRDVNQLPPKHSGGKAIRPKDCQGGREVSPNTLEAYKAMNKEELLLELIKLKVEEARLKKGYEVKGDGTVIRYSSKNTK